MEYIRQVNTSQAVSMCRFLRRIDQTWMARKASVGIRFPVQNDDVYLTSGGGYNPRMSGGGIVPEGAALLAAGVMIWLSMKLAV